MKRFYKHKHKHDYKMLCPTVASCGQFKTSQSYALKAV